MNRYRPTTLLDRTYEVGLFFKGFDGVVELIGGVLVLALSPAAILHIAQFLTQHVFQAHWLQFVSHSIDKEAHHLATGETTFAALFLLSHGIVKVVLVGCLLLNKLWAYPWALIILSLFLIYEVYVLITKPTFGIAFLSILDAVIIYLVWREWQKVRHPNVKAA